MGKHTQYHRAVGIDLKIAFTTLHSRIMERLAFPTTTLNNQAPIFLRIKKERQYIKTKRINGCKGKGVLVFKKRLK